MKRMQMIVDLKKKEEHKLWERSVLKNMDQSSAQN